jgi:hypothetical protein
VYARSILAHLDVKSLCRLAAACTTSSLAVAKVFTDITLPWLHRPLEIDDLPPHINRLVRRDGRGRARPTNAQMFRAVQAVVAE